jgi:hypothetical protein
MPRSDTSWIGKIFNNHPNTPYRHGPNSGRALKAMSLIAPLADADKYRPIAVPFVEPLEEKKTPGAGCSHRHTRVKDSLVLLSSCDYWTFARGHFAYTKLNYLSSRFNSGAGIIASNQRKGGHYGTGKLGLCD